MTTFIAKGIKLGLFVWRLLLRTRGVSIFLTGPFGTSQDEHEDNTTAFGHHDPFNSSNGTIHDEPPPPYESVVMGEGVFFHLVRMYSLCRSYSQHMYMLLAQEALSCIDRCKM